MGVHEVELNSSQEAAEARVRIDLLRTVEGRSSDVSTGGNTEEITDGTGVATDDHICLEHIKIEDVFGDGHDEFVICSKTKTIRHEVETNRLVRNQRLDAAKDFGKDLESAALLVQNPPSLGPAMAADGIEEVGLWAAAQHRSGELIEVIDMEFFFDFIVEILAVAGRTLHHLVNPEESGFEKIEEDRDMDAAVDLEGRPSKGLIIVMIFAKIFKRFGPVAESNQIVVIIIEAGVPKYAHGTDLAAPACIL